MKAIPKSKYKTSQRFWREVTGKVIRFTDFGRINSSKKWYSPSFTGKVMGIDNTAKYLRIRIVVDSIEHFRIPASMHKLHILDLEDEIIWKLENE